MPWARGGGFYLSLVVMRCLCSVVFLLMFLLVSSYLVHNQTVMHSHVWIDYVILMFFMGSAWAVLFGLFSCVLALGCCVFALCCCCIFLMCFSLLVHVSLS